MGMKPELRQGVAAYLQPKRRLVDPHHQRVLAAANAAIASREFRKISIDLDADGTAVAGAPVPA
jgi:hypothetical protein